MVVMENARAVDVPRSGLVNFVKRRFYANIDAVLVPAPSHVGIGHQFGIASDRVFFGLNVVDNDFFLKNAGAFAAGSATALPTDFFVGVGRQVSKKNWGLLLSAYNLYRHRHPGPHWDLVLVGDGPDRENLETQIRDQSIDGVRLLPFHQPHEMPAIYAAAKCLILPSLYGETWGLTVNEAMASGLPVLVSEECGCAKTLVDEEKNGWTFSPHRTDELAALLARLSQMEPSSRAAMGVRSRQIISEWSVDRFARGAFDAIQSCATVRRSFASPLDRLILSCWKGRFRPT
jgi:glycosyltransferase involved in cell wall biosynthesis